MTKLTFALKGNQTKLENKINAAEDSPTFNTTSIIATTVAGIVAMLIALKNWFKESPSPEEHDNDDDDRPDDGHDDDDDDDDRPDDGHDDDDEDEDDEDFNPDEESDEDSSDDDEDSGYDTDQTDLENNPDGYLAYDPEENQNSKITEYTGYALTGAAISYAVYSGNLESLGSTLMGASENSHSLLEGLYSSAF